MFSNENNALEGVVLDAPVAIMRASLLILLSLTVLVILLLLCHQITVPYVILGINICW